MSNTKRRFAVEGREKSINVNTSRLRLSILFLFLPCTLFLGGKSSDSTPDSAERAAASDVEAYASLYRSMQLEGVVNWKAFRQAVAGYYKIDNRNIKL